MNSHRLSSRLDMTKAQGNILMTQIRAEKRQYHTKGEYNPTSQRENMFGKKQFPDILYQNTSITSSFNKQNYGEHLQRSSHFGKRMNIECSRTPSPLNPSRSGKKRFPMHQNIESTSPVFKKIYKAQIIEPKKSGRKRFDHSPFNQNANSSIFPIGSKYQ